MESKNPKKVTFTRHLTLSKDTENNTLNSNTKKYNHEPINLSNRSKTKRFAGTTLKTLKSRRSTLFPVSIDKEFDKGMVIDRKYLTTLSLKTKNEELINILSLIVNSKSKEKENKDDKNKLNFVFINLSKKTLLNMFFIVFLSLLLMF